MTDTPPPEPTGPAHPAIGLDDVVHQRVRLGILTVAHEARRVEFGYLRTQLRLTGGNLSQHLSVLEAAGLVEVEKGYAGRRARTWITLTDPGRAALVEEIARLKLLIIRIETTDSPDRGRDSGHRADDKATSPKGRPEATADSATADSHPDIGTLEKSLPGLAEPPP